MKVSHREQGLRHGDYRRYRQYCARRLRRLYKTSENFCHKKDLGPGGGNEKQKHKFEKKPLRGEDGAFLIQDPSRELLIPLVQSERCWALANELKDDNLMGGAMNAAKRAHAKKRLKKACTHAKEFKDACAHFGDAKLKLESEAYCSYILGVTDLNDGAKKNCGAVATRELTRAKKIYELLGKVGPTEHKMNYEGRARELELMVSTGIRLANDFIDVKKEVAEAEREVENSTNMREATELLKLSDPLLTGGETTLASHIQWRSKQFKVYGEFGMRTYGAVQKILNRLKSEASTLSVDKTLTLYKKLFVHIKETKKHLTKACRDAESMSFGSEYDEEDLAQLRLSTQALDVLVLEKEISRDAFLAERLGAKLFDKTSRMKHKSDRNLKFEHLVRVYDALIASNYILADAAMEIIRGADADAIIEKLESDIDNDIEKYKKSREGALQRALTEPNDPIASKVKALKVSSSGGMPRVVLEGKNIAEFVYNRGEPSVQFEQARAEHAKATGIPTPVSPIPSPRATSPRAKAKKQQQPTADVKKNQNESDSEGFHSADEEEGSESSEYSQSSDYESSDYEDAGPGYISSAAGALGKLFSRG